LKSAIGISTISNLLLTTNSAIMRLLRMSQARRRTRNDTLRRVKPAATFISSILQE